MSNKKEASTDDKILAARINRLMEIKDELNQIRFNLDKIEAQVDELLEEIQPPII
jgi:hypothetical protein